MTNEREELYADLNRILVNARWRRLVTDPETGLQREENDAEYAARLKAEFLEKGR